jgi:tetratricopeptide (TPR) repeat protein
MQRKSGFLATALMLCAVLSVAMPALAQGTSELSGVLKDMDGKPYADATLVLKNTTTGAELTVQSDKSGRYSFVNIRPGACELTVKDPTGFALLQSRLDVHAGVNPLDLNLKDLVNPEQLAARRKAEKESQKLQGMKAAFDAGRGVMDKADDLRGQMAKAPLDQRAAMQDQLKGLYQEALQDFQNAQSSAVEKDPNLHLFYYNMGLAYEGLGQNDQAVEAYRKAIEAAQGTTGKMAPSKNQLAGYYSNLGNLYGKLKKVEEANKAYEAAAAADPANAGIVWLNSGITLYKANRLEEAVVPFKKATELLPTNAQAWFLLGASLVSTMDVKQEGEKQIPILKPGTVEAYQKCIELDPNGTWGTQAKEGLEQLQAMGAGIETKVKAKKGKS